MDTDTALDIATVGSHSANDTPREQAFSILDG